MKITEYYTNEQIKVESAIRMINQSKQQSNSFKKRRYKFDRYLVFKSVNAAEKVQSKKKGAGKLGRE